MAASIGIVTLKFGKTLCLCNCLRSFSLSRRLLAASDKPQQNSDAADNDEYFDREAVEKHIAKLRDASGMNAFEKMRLNGQLPVFNTKRKYFYTRAFQRKLFARYGAASGINPGIMFPSKAELADMNEIDRDWTPSFQDLMKQIQDEKQAHSKAEKERIERVEKNMAKMPAMIDDFQKKQQIVVAESRRKERTEQYLDEFREKFGFTVTLDNPKFKSFVKARIDEDKVKVKRAKKMSKKEAQEKIVQQMLEQGSGAKY
ncbi:growth arrest and DNA damage-inducible proteins-interacting protein 1-like [Dreissena polymorpha]|uniref:Large ribosomal subunit protein mL64 n=1 Tax=Dreissena polymorpha TaxID=45954 RepID=A0A9D4BI69_DREPO|nr:growth arrest and DNA damage-inducible proteins-interacting protein 1-like [Dreissena polymorpha]KAH3695739.1 hypothetical protein DPMN_083197 [Dreissena polymorpha]